MAHLHCRTRIPIMIPIRTGNQMATLYCAEVFTLHRVGFGIRNAEYSDGIGIGIGICIFYFYHKQQVNKYLTKRKDAALCLRRIIYVQKKRRNCREKDRHYMKLSTHSRQCNNAHWKSMELYHRSNVPFSYQISFPIPTQNVFAACHKPISFLFFFVTAKHFKRKTNQQKQSKPIWTTAQSNLK